MSELITGAMPLFKGLSMTQDMKTGKFTFTGVFEEPYNEMLDLIFRGYNYTLIPCFGLMSDCLDLAMANKSDMIMNYINYIAVPDYDKITYIHPMLTTGFYVISAYNCSWDKAKEDSQEIDIAHSLDSFDLSTWLILMLFCLCLIFLARWNFWIVRKNRQEKKLIHQIKIRKRTHLSAMWTFISHILDQPMSYFYSWKSRLLSILMTLFAFFVIECFFFNLMAVERMSMKEQFVYRSYQDIATAIKNSNPPSIHYYPLGGIAEHFKNSGNENTKIIYDEIMRQNKTTIKNMFLYDENIGYDFNTIMLGGTTFTTFVKYTACKYFEPRRNKTNIDLCLHRNQELDDDIIYTSGFVGSKYYSDRPIFKSMQHRMQGNFEFGICNERTSGTEKHIPANRMDCMSEDQNLIRYDPDFSPIAIDFFNKFLLVVFAMLTLGGLVLLCEIGYDNFIGRVLFELENSNDLVVPAITITCAND